MNRDEDWRRVSEMAGLDGEGGILPPAPGTKISREPAAWKNGYADLLSTPPKDNGPYIRAVAILRDAVSGAERALGGPVYIDRATTDRTADHGYVTTFHFRRVEGRRPEPPSD